MTETLRPAPFLLDVRAPQGMRRFVNGALEQILGLRELNRIYASLPAGAAPDAWIDAALAAVGTDFTVDAADRARIPAKGAVVVVANHPFGAVEGLLLLRLLRAVRPDVRVLANRLLTRIPELRELLLDVDVFGGAAAPTSNVPALRQAIRWLRGGGMLALFPAGEVASLRFGEGVVDPAWCEDVAAFVRLGRADALPVRFEGTNGALFQAAGLVHPRLRTALLPRELLNKSRVSVRVRVGSPIRHDRLVAIGSDADVTGYLRMRTDLLGRRSAPVAGSRSASTGDPIAAPEDRAVLAAEVAALPAERTFASNGALSVVLAAADEAPALLREVGRCREIAFREVGEGTGRASDLDRFDAHYRHLVLWDRDARAVAGAYRIASTSEVLARQGPSGFYTSTLFRLPAEFFERLGPACELGRSFVAPAYQRSFSPLMLLWKGIGACVLADPACRTLFGPVSISRRYAPFARQLMIEWLRLRAPATEFETLAHPRRPVRARRGEIARARAAGARLADMDDLSDAVADLEPELRGVPILLREYHRLAGRFAAFNVDPDFGDVVDGLVVIDLAKTEPRILSRYVGKAGTAAFLARHGGRGRST